MWCAETHANAVRRRAVALASSLRSLGAMKEGVQVYRYMTPCPHTVQRDATCSAARETMDRYGIRHLPVLDQGDLVGILSDRELAVAERLGDPSTLVVGEVMTPEPYIALPSTLLADVADEMARKKYGAAVIVDRGNVVGVFTAIDALRAIAENRVRPALPV
jgi:acetoin utilization protein AcuB